MVAVKVADYGPWTGVCLADDRAHSAAPYDVGLEIMAARPAPMFKRPSIGFFVMGRRAVVTVHAKGWRAAQRWLVWEPGIGVRTTPELASLPPALLVRAAGAARTCSLSTLSGLVSQTQGTALDLQVTLLRALGLPGEELLVEGGSDHLTEVLPSARSVRAFDRLVADEANHRTDLEAIGDDR